MTDKLFNLLNEPKKIKSESKRIAERIEDARLMMLPSAIRYDKDKVISSPSDPMLKFAERLDELERERNRLAVKYIEATDRVIQISNDLSKDVMKSIIQWKFIRGFKFYQIAQEIEYSEAQTYRLYADAIDELEKMIVNDSNKMC